MMSKSITEKKTNETIKRELLNSLQENDDVQEQGLNKTASNASKSQEAILIINLCEGITLLKYKIKRQ